MIGPRNWNRGDAERSVGAVRRFAPGARGSRGRRMIAPARCPGFGRFPPFWSAVGGPGGRGPRSGAATLIALVALLSAAGAPARADALVSNIDLVDSADLSLAGTVRLQEFTAGDENAALGDIEIKFSSGSDDLDPPTVTLRRRDGESYVLVAELTGSKKLTGGDNAFAAPANTALEAGSVYAVRLEGGGSGVAVRGSTDNSESGESGWSVGNDSLHRSSGATSYETNSNALMIRVIEAGERFDPFEPPLAPSLSVSETTSTDGSWTVSWGGAEAGEFYTHVELEETPPSGTASTTTFYDAPGNTSISGKTVAGAYKYRVKGCSNLCSDWSGSLTVTYAPNSQPVVGAISDLTVSRGSTGTRSATVTDGDTDDTHTVTASSSDEGVATVSVSGKALTARGVSRGTATITVTATDNSGESNDTSAAVEFDVTVPNSRPVVSSISDLTVSRGSTGRRTASVTDGDTGDTHTVSASSSDEGVATVSVSGKTLTVRGVSRGTATITVTATDNSGESNDTSAAVEFDVTVPNSRPVVGSISDLTVSRGSTGRRTASATDGDTGDTHTVSASSSDEGVATVSVSGKTLTVRGVSRGTATITVTATDNSGESNDTSAAVEFDVTVPNSRPVVSSISDLTVSQGSTGTRTVTVTDGDSGDTHEVSARSDNAAVTVSVSGKTLTLAGVSRGDATITVTATDNSGESNATSAAVEFDVTVELSNSRPEVGPFSDRTISRGSTDALTVSVRDSDSGDRHTVAASSDATGVATVRVSGKTLTMTGVSRGDAMIEVTATDDSRAANDTSLPAEFHVTVPNTRPVVGSIPDATVTRGSTATRTATVTDGDSGDTHTVTASSGNTGVATVRVRGKTLTVRGLSCGAATMTVTARDNSGESNATSAAKEFDVTVPNSRPSVGSISDLTVSRGSTGTRTVSVTDRDSGDTPAVSASSSDNGVATVSVSGRRLTVRGVSRGTATITATATDECGATGSAEFGVTVPNSRPVVGSISDLTVSRGSSGTRTASVTDGDTGDTHTVSANSSATGVATVSVNGKTLTVRGLSCGAATMTVTARDNSGESNATSAAKEFDVTVTGGGPAVGPISDVTVPRGSTGTRTVTVTGGDGLTVSASSNDTSVATVSVSVSGNTLTLRLAGVSRGTATIEVTASDSCGASAPVEFDVTVPNSRPEVGSISDMTVSRGTTATETVSVADGDTGDTHRVSASSDRTSVATVSVSGKTLTLTGLSCGVATIEVAATDDSGASNATSDEEEFDVTVTGGGPAVGSISDVTVPRGSTGTRTVTVTGGDGLTVSASSNDTSVATVSVSVSGNTLTLRLAGVSRGTATVEVTASDGCGTSAPVEFDVTVPNSRPEVATIPDQKVTIGGTQTVPVEVADADSGDTHAVSATSSNEAVATVSETGNPLTLAGVAVGRATVTVTATDDSGATHAVSEPVPFAVRVPPPVPGAITGPDSSVTGQYLLSWGASSGATSYRLEQRIDDGAWRQVYDGALTVLGFARQPDGTYEYRVRACAGDDNCSDWTAPPNKSVTVALSSNSQPAVSPIADLAMTTDGASSAQVEVEVTDADADDSHTISATSSNEAVATVGTQGLTLTVTRVAIGMATITVTATDSSEALNAESRPETFAVNVSRSGNHRPVVAPITDKKIAIGQMLTVPIEVTDADEGDAHTLSATSSKRATASVSTDDATLALEIAGAAAGIAMIEVTATDGSDADNAASEPVTFAVRVPPPVPGPITGPETSATGNYVLEWGRSAGATSYVLEQNAGDELWDDIFDGTGITLGVYGALNGTYQYRVKACAGAGNCSDSTATKTVTVSIPNRRPVVSPIEDQSVMKGADHAIEIPVTVTDADEGAEHTLSATSADDMIATVAAEGSTLTITGVAVGGARITVTADDRTGADNAVSEAVTFMVSVREYTGQIRANPNPSNDGAYTLSWDAREGHPYHILLEGDADASSKKVFYPGEALKYSFVGKAPGPHRYELYHCDFNIDDIPFTLTLGSGTCAGTDIPEVTVTVNAAVGPSNINSDTKAGATPYRTGVTQGGDAYVNIPIEPAPGVNGLAPLLSIDYGGGRERELAEQSLPWDTLGYGWHLSGFSTIRRCFVNQPGPAANLLDTDNLCLDGEPLVLTSGTALQPDAEYRLLRERFVKVTVKGTSPHVWFEAKGPDGSVSEYGNTEDSQLHFVTDYFNGSATMEKAFQWSINKRTDAFDNSMSYAYHKDESAGVRHPLRVVYGNGGDAAVEFKYVHRSDLSAVMLGSSSTRAQAQNLLLREIRVLRDASVGADGAPSGKLVRAYRLQTETEGAQRRLDRVQLCGYGETGAGEKCLAPIDVDWTTPDTDLSVVVGRLTDSLGRKTEFEYGVLEERASHAFLFAERPFGNPPASISGTSVLDGDDPNDADEALKAVVTKMKRANGLADAETATSGWHETSYAYQGRGRKSELGWGFLGFDATRSTDEASGVVAYRRYRMDFPHYGEVGAVYEYDGAYGSSGTEAMYQRVTTRAVENISHGGTLAAQTKLPRVDDVFEFHFEGGAQIGATKTDHALTVTSGLPASASSTVIVYHTLSPPAGGSSATWGAAPSGTGSSPQRKTASATTFENRTSGGKWAIGFASRIEEKHHRGGVSAADVTAVTTSGRSGNATNTLRPSWTLRFPGDGEHELRTAYIYDTDGNATSVTLGTGATSRADSASGFIDSRYPGTLTNAKNHSETLTHDARFGLVKTLTDPNNRTTTLAHDAFGRETLRETPDGVEIETSYESCADSGVDCSAVAGAGSDASVTPVMRIKETSTKAASTDEPAVEFTSWRYLDKLGRTIRTETESFAGTARVRRDTRYDARGRVRLASQPYYSNETAHRHEYAYDARGRVLSETRPDGGVTTMTYIVNTGNTSQIKATATEQVYKRGLLGTPIRETTRETVSLYNVMGELVSRTEGANATATTDKATVTIAYNGAGQPTTHTAAGSATTFGYDSAGFRDRVTSPNLGAVTFEYTEFGELYRRTDGKGTATWSYDALGRATKRRDPDGVAEWRYDPTMPHRAISALERRCYEKDANAMSCADLSAPDFKETLAYGQKARLSGTTATIDVPGGNAKTYAHSFTYYTDGRLKTAIYPSGLTAHHEYNARGYRTILRRDSSAGAALETRSAMDAHGNVTGVTYGNGVTTTRIFDPKTGRAKDIDTVASGGTKIQDNVYVWRSDGLLESRASHVGGNNARLETFAYDPLGRLKTATTKLNNSATATRTLSQTYHANGNLNTKTSSVGADISVSAYGYDASKPHRLTSATIDGKTHAFSHDADGNIKKYDCTSATCVDDKYIEWNGRNLPHRITVGGSQADDTPTSRDEFAYGPDGARYHRKTSYMDGETLRTENTYYAGSFEELLPRAGAAHTSIRQTRVTDGVRHVKTTAVATADDGTKTTTTANHVDYIHKDHLGSVEGVTGAAGARTRTLAYDPYGGRRKADWTAALTPAEISALAGSSDPRTRGHTGHEHLDRTGLIHRGGRVYDPTLGRFLSPDPLVGNRGSAQSVERLQLRLEQPDELRRSERAVAGARGWGLRLGRRDVRRGRGRLRPGERGLDAPLPVGGHLLLRRLPVDDLAIGRGHAAL